MPSQQDLLSAIRRVSEQVQDDHTTYEVPDLNSGEFAQAIDHTILKLDANEAQVDLLCEEAKKYSFGAVCVRLNWVDRAVQHLRNTSIRVACVVGFHEGTHETQEKESEAAEAVQIGALELDMVINYPLLKSGNFTEVYEDIVAVRRAAPSEVRLKVILETSQLTDSEIIAGCVVADIAGADYVKTSTGFCGEGASVRNVRLMRNVVGHRLGVKASGGIRSTNDCIAMMEAGASRIGTSNGVAIVEGARSGKRYQTRDSPVGE